MRIKKKLFLTLFMSFALVLLFPIVVETVLYHSMQSIIREDTNRSNQAMLNQISLMVEGRLQEAEQLAMQISLQPRVQLMIKRKQDMPATTVYEYKQLLDTLNLYKPSTHFILDYYVYLREQDAVVTPYVKVDSAQFFANYHKYETLSYQEWLGHLHKSGSSSHFLPALPVIQRSTLASERLITYIRPLPYGQSGDASGALVLLIKEQRIRELLENLDGLQQAKILITDKNGQLITSSSTSPLYDEALGNLDTLLSNENKEHSFQVNGETILVTSIQSEESGWRYISLAPKSVLMEKVTKVQTWALSLLVFCLVFGLVGSFLFARLYYSPVKRLVRSIHRNRNTEEKLISGEFHLIEETLHQSWQSENQMRDALDKQTPAIQSNFLHRFIKGLTDLKSIHPESLSFMGIRFVSDAFAVIIIEVDDSGKFSYMDGERQWAIMRFVLTNVSQELFEPYHTVYTVELDRNRLALLINITPQRLSHGKSDIEATVGHLKSYIEQKFGICTSIGVGEIHYGDVGTSYAEALMALDYRLIKGKSNVTYYREIPYDEQQYYYPFEIELQLMNTIKSGNFASADQLLDHIYDMNFGSKPVSLELGKFLYFNMLSTLMKIRNDSPERFVKVFGDGFNPVASLVECGSLIELHEQVKSIYKTICEAVTAEKREPGAILVEKIIQHIELHYAENALGLNTIAAHFQLTPPYISGLFKKHHGQNLAEFIMRYRVEKARALLLDDNLTLNQVAHGVGYANAAGFIRVFKKYTGITPGIYREQMKQAGANEGVR